MIQVVQPERRKVPRRRTLKAGLISFNRAATIECQVRNLSPVGACLDVSSQIGIPDEFTLVVDHERLKKKCRVIWRKPTRLGVEFEAEKLASDPAAAEPQTA
jgi:hypothetical protein